MGIDAQLALECLDLLGTARELTALRLGDPDDGEAAFAVDHGGDAQLAHQTVAPFRLRDGTGGRGVLVQGLAVQPAPAPVRSLHPRRYGDVRVQCGSTVTLPVLGSVTGQAVRCTNSGMTSLARTASVVLVFGLNCRAQPALSWRYSAAAWTPSPWTRRMVARVRSSPSA